MKFWQVKRGNTSVQDIEVRDRHDALITDLDEAEEIKFQIKENKTDTVAKIEKTDTDGIEVDKPTQGYVRITLLPTDTAAEVFDIDKHYFMALQVKWSATKIYEVIMKIDKIEAEYFKVVQHVIT